MKYVIILAIFVANLCYAEFIDFYPNIKPLESYTRNLSIYLQGKNKTSKYIVVRKYNIFNSSKEILTAVQKQIIHFAVIPLRTLKSLDVLNNLNPLINSVYNSENTQQIPLKLKLRKYGIFLISLLPAGKYYLFTNISNLEKKKKSKVSICCLNDIFIKYFKKKFNNVLPFDNIDSIKGYIEKGFFNSVVMTSVDYSRVGIRFSNAYDFNLTNEKYCFIANSTYWSKMPQEQKLLFWSFCDKYNRLFNLDFKKFQDKIINKISVFSFSHN